jgi:hypothetical protein
MKSALNLKMMKQTSKKHTEMLLHECYQLIHLYCLGIGGLPTASIMEIAARFELGARGA